MNREMTDFSQVATEGAAIRTIQALDEERQRILAGRPTARVPSRIATDSDRQAVNSDIREEYERSAADYLRGYRAEIPLLDSIVSIIRRAAVRRGATRFDDANAMRPMRDVIEAKTRALAPIPFFIPVGGDKAGSPLKTGSYFLPDATEDMLLVKLAALARSVSSIYSPGARVIVMPDAPLHSADLGFSVDQYRLHIGRLEQRITELSLNPFIAVADTPQYLPASWHDEVEKHMRVANTRFNSGDEVFRRSFLDQVASLVYSINTRVYSWDFSTQVLVNSAVAGHREGVPADIVEAARHLESRARLVTPHYIGVNAAIRSTGLAERITHELAGSSNHVRLTVHAKPGEPRPALAQANAASRPGLLPMHSLALRFTNSEGRSRYAAIFELEAVVNEWRPVLNTDGALLYYEPNQHAGLRTVGKAA